MLGISGTHLFFFFFFFFFCNLTKCSRFGEGLPQRAAVRGRDTEVRDPARRHLLHVQGPASVDGLREDKGGDRVELEADWVRLY